MDKYIDDGPITADTLDDYYLIWQKSKEKFLKDNNITMQCFVNDSLVDKDTVTMNLRISSLPQAYIEVRMVLSELDKEATTLEKQWKVNGLLTAGLHKLMLYTGQ